MAELSKQALELSLVAKTLNERNVFDRVYDISGGYNTLSLLTNMLNKNGAKQVNTVKYETATMDNMNIATTIASNAASGTNLIVYFSDPTFNLCREGDTVADTERIMGRVISFAPGQITIQPVNVSSWNTATNFIAGMTCKVFFDSSVNRFSVGKQTIISTPDLDYNYSSVTRDSVQLAREDFLNTYVKQEGRYWWFNQEAEMMQRLMRGVEHKFIFSPRQQLTDASGATVNYNGGLIWAIDNRGGTHISSSSPLTQSIFIDLLRQVKQKNAAGAQSLVCYYGLAAKFTIDQMTQQFIQFAGTNNTFGVASRGGLDIKSYRIAGVEVSFVPMPILDDPILFPEMSTIPGVRGTRMSNSFFLLDVSPIPVKGGGYAPAIERFYFGEREFMYGYVPGMIGPEGAAPSTLMTSGYALQATDVDGFSCHGLTQNGINIADAKNMLFWELGA